jgi:glycosyltransferase involved in cell wall biosynthesis
VLHVCEYAAPYRGSFIRQLELLDDELGARGLGRSAFAFPRAAGGTDWFARMARDSREVYTLPPPGGRALAGAQSAIRALIDSTKCDIVHSHFAGYDLASAVAVARARAAGHGQALIWHYRTALECSPAERSLAQRVKDGVKFRGLGSRVDRHVAVTEALAREAVARGADGHVSALVAGCDTDAFRPDPDARLRARAALHVADDEVLVLHFGWHWKRKGGDLLVAAAKLLADRAVQRLRFVSVGAPPQEIAPPVRHAPFTEQVADLHRAADIFVSASRSEGFGNGLMEAFAAGTPAVATLVDGQRELFERVPGCLGTTPGDAAAIADAIESLLEQRADWPRLGALNREHVVRHHSMRDWARRMADLYEEVAAR